MKNYGPAIQPRVPRTVPFPYFIEREREAIILEDKRYSQMEVLARLGIIFLVVILGAVALAFWFYGFGLNSRINVLEKKLTELRRTNDLETIKTARLENLDRLYQVATEKFFLMKPQRVEYIYID